MNHDPKLQQVARQLIGEHGPEAISVARHRAKIRAAIGDRGAADVWSSVAAEAKMMLTHSGHEPSSEHRGEPVLTDVLDGRTARRMMDADRVSREDVEEVLGDAKRRHEET